MGRPVMAHNYDGDPDRRNRNMGNGRSAQSGTTNPSMALVMACGFITITHHRTVHRLPRNRSHWAYMQATYWLAQKNRPNPSTCSFL